VGAGLLTLALLVGGCGGGGEETSAEHLISKAALLKKGNAFCNKKNEELTAAFTPFVEEHRSDDVQFAIEHVIPMRSAEVKYLRHIGPPAEDAEQFEKLLTAMEEGISRAKQDPHSMLESEEHFAFSRAFDIGLDFGLEKCWLA